MFEGWSSVLRAMQVSRTDGVFCLHYRPCQVCAPSQKLELFTTISSPVPAGP